MLQHNFFRLARTERSARIAMQCGRTTTPACGQRLTTRRRIDRNGDQPRGVSVSFGCASRRAISHIRNPIAAHSFSELLGDVAQAYRFSCGRFGAKAVKIPMTSCPFLGGPRLASPSVSRITCFWPGWPALFSNYLTRSSLLKDDEVRKLRQLLERLEAHQRGGDS